MVKKHFNKLNIPTQWEQYWSKYPNGYSIMEALIDWVSQVDDMVDTQNDLSDTVSDYRKELDSFIGHFDGRLQEEVTDLLTDWQTSGFLDVVIDQALDTKYHEMDERLTTQMDQIAHTLSEDEDLQSIIDYISNQNGGTIYIGHNRVTSDTILVKENVTIEFRNNASITPSFIDKPVFRFYRFSNVSYARVELPDAYDAPVFEFRNIELRSDNLNTSSKAEVTVYKPKITILRSSLKERLTGFRIVSSGATSNYFAGVWDINIISPIVMGVDKVLHLQTMNDGWITGCKFKNFTGDYFKNVVHVQADGGTIAANLFDDFQMQTRAYTETCVIDSADNNKYSNFYFFDIHTHANANIGVVKLDNYGWQKTPSELPIIGYASSNYQKMGTFTSLSGSAIAEWVAQGQRTYAIFSVYFSSGQPYVRITNIDRAQPLNKTNTEFYVVENNGLYDLYVRFIGISYNVNFVSGRSLLFAFNPHRENKTSLNNPIKANPDNYFEYDMARLTDLTSILSRLDALETT